MKVRAGTAILMITMGLDCINAQNLSPLYFSGSTKQEGKACLIRKYTANLAMDTQYPVNMEGFYKITAHRLDSIAVSLEAEVSSRYQQSCIELLKAWPFDEDGNVIMAEKDLDAEAERAKGLQAVEWLRRKAGELRYRYRTVNKFSFFPVRNTTDAELYHQYNSDTNEIGLKNVRLGVQSATGQYSFYTDFYSDYFGPVAVGVGTLLGIGSRDEEDTSFSESGVQETSAMNRLLFGGGNVVIHLAYPVMYWTKPDQKLDFRVRLQPRLGFDIPDLGAQTFTYAMNLDMGVYSTLNYTGLKENMGIVVEFKSSLITGNSRFYENLGREHNQNPIVLNQLSFGLKLGKKFQITWIRYWDTIFEKSSQPSILSFSMAVN